MTKDKTTEDKERQEFEAYYNGRYDNIDSEFAAVLRHTWQAARATRPASVNQIG